MNSERLKKQQAQSTLLTIGIFSIIMLFAGLTSAYIVSKGSMGGQWDNIILPDVFYLSTGAIIISGFLGFFTIKYCKLNNYKIVSQLLLWTIILGCVFCYFQFLGWEALIRDNKFLSGNNVASSYIYVFTLIHVFHLIGGLFTLVIIYFKSLRKKYNDKNFHGLKLGIRFWHFLGFLWVYLFSFLLLIN